MKIGGCFDKKHSKPVKVTGNVKLISDGRWIARARGYNTGITTCMGRTVVLESGQVHILIAERSAMTVDPELFRSHGIDPVYCKIVVVKSPNGFAPPINRSPGQCSSSIPRAISTANLKTLAVQAHSATHLSVGPRYARGPPDSNLPMRYAHCNCQEDCDVTCWLTPNILESRRPCGFRRLCRDAEGRSRPEKRTGM